MERNPAIEKGFARGAPSVNFKQKWDDFAKKINAAGPPIRDGEGWQKLKRMYDLKCKTKKKLVHNKAKCNATGGGIFKQMMLTPLEESVANMMQFNKNLNPEGLVCGVEQRPETHAEVSHETLSIIQSVDLPEIIITDKIASTSNEISQKNPNKRTRRESDQKNKETLLEMHTSMQEKFLKERSNNLKETACYQRKIYDNQEKQLKLVEMRNKKKEELFEKDMELKKSS